VEKYNKEGDKNLKKSNEIGSKSPDDKNSFINAWKKSIKYDEDKYCKNYDTLATNLINKMKNNSKNGKNILKGSKSKKLKSKIYNK